MFGILSFFVLFLIYLRSGLKFFARRNASLKEKPFFAKTLNFLSKQHTLLGVLSVIFVFAHCLIENQGRDNLFLIILLITISILGLSGFAMKSKALPEKLRHQSYYLHVKWLNFWVVLAIFILGHSFL